MASKNGHVHHLIIAGIIVHFLPSEVGKVERVAMTGLIVLFGLLFKNRSFVLFCSH